MMNLYGKIVVLPIILICSVVWSCTYDHDTPEEPVIEPILTCSEIIAEFAPGVDGLVTYDSDRDRLVYVGNEPIQTWEWIDDRWLRMNTDSYPPPLIWSNLVYFPPAGCVVLIGIVDDFQLEESIDLWQMWYYNDQNWHQYIPEHFPDNPCGRIVYDPANERLLLTNGDDVWSFDGIDWEKLHIQGNCNSSLNSKSIGFDVARLRLVLTGYYSYGGSQSLQTWECDGHEWSQVNPNQGPHGELIFDRREKRLFAISAQYGGTVIVYRYEASEWVVVNETSFYCAPTAATYDDGCGKIITFSPSCTMSFTPEEGWRPLFPQDRPINQSDALAAYFPPLEVTIMVVPSPCVTDRIEVWSWDGTSFQLLPEAPQISSTYSCSIVYDPTRRCILLFDPINGYYNCSIRTWQFDGRDWL